MCSPSTEAACEPDNPHDHHGVCLRKTEVIIGHGRAPPPSQGTALSVVLNVLASLFGLFDLLFIMSLSQNGLGVNFDAWYKLFSR